MQEPSLLILPPLDRLTRLQFRIEVNLITAYRSPDPYRLELRAVANLVFAATAAGPGRLEVRHHRFAAKRVEAVNKARHRKS
jgi:hypothetical protein